MKEYHKIQTVFLRTPESKFKTLMEGHWALPEFEVLKDIPWVWTEKVDGTNIRIMWSGTDVTFGGKTDNAQIPASLVKVLQTKFTPDKLKAVFNDTPACLYGEGYGMSIQKEGSQYLLREVDFILFDCRVGHFWFTRLSLEDVASKLEIGIVPVIGTGTLLEAVDFVKKGYTSTISHDKGLMAEGLILKPVVELFNRQGHRIIAKIKFRDFPR